VQVLIYQRGRCAEGQIELPTPIFGPAPPSGLCRQTEPKPANCRYRALQAVPVPDTQSDTQTAGQLRILADNPCRGTRVEQTDDVGCLWAAPLRLL